MNKISKKYEILGNYLINQFETFFINEGIRNERFTINEQISLGYCFLYSYLLYKLANSKGLYPRLAYGPYHTFVMQDDIVYDTFNIKGCEYNNIKLSDSFLKILKKYFYPDLDDKDFYKKFYAYKFIDVDSNPYFQHYIKNQSNAVKRFLVNTLKINKLKLDDELLKLN